MSQRPGSPSTSAIKGMFTKFDKKKAADAGTAALVAGLKGVKAVLDTSSIPGASAVFSVILACIDEQQVSWISIPISYLSHFRLTCRKHPGMQTF